MPDNLRETFRTRLRKALLPYRGRLKLVAWHAGVHPSYLSYLQHPRANPTLEAVERIASAVNVSPFWLLGSDTGGPAMPITKPSGLSADQWARIDMMRAAGCTWSDITRTLNGEGCFLNTSSLQRAWRRAHPTN